MGTLSQMLEKASQTMGVAVEQVYNILLQQAKVELVWDILGIIAIILILAVCYTLAYKLYKAESKYDYYKNYTGAVLTALLPTIFGGVFGTMAVIEIVQILVNPPVWVLEFLVKMFQ